MVAPVDVTNTDIFSLISHVRTECKVAFQFNRSIYSYMKRERHNIWQVSSPVAFATTWDALVRSRSVDSLFYTISIRVQQWADKIVGLLMKINSRKVILLLQQYYFVQISKFLVIWCFFDRASWYRIISSTNFNAKFSLFINNMFVTLLSSTCFEH